MAATLRPTKAPNLIVARNEYDRQQQELFKQQLRQYFDTIDNFSSGVIQVVVGEGIAYPDGTLQKTAWEPSYIEAYDRSTSISIPTTPTLLKPANFLPPVSEGITYDPATGEFTFQYAGVYSLSIALNILGSNPNQIVYVYAQKNTGTGWANTPNSGKAYRLFNNVNVQYVNPQSVYRAAGEKTRYYIYASALGPVLETLTLPGTSPAVYVPAIRIQFAGG